MSEKTLLPKCALKRWFNSHGGAEAQRETENEIIESVMALKNDILCDTASLRDKIFIQKTL